MRFPVGYLISFVLIVWGYWLGYLGIIGALTWSIETFGVDSAMVDASVGAFMITAGFYMMWLIRYRAN